MERRKFLEYAAASGLGLCETNLAYGQKNVFTLHSFRHTFITDLLLKTRDIAGNGRQERHEREKAEAANALTRKQVAVS